MKKSIILLFLFLFISAIQIGSAELVGVGIGTTEDEARKYSLQDLSMQIEVEVQSSVIDKLEELQSGGITVSSEYSQSIVFLKSEMPILGAKFDTIKKGKQFYCNTTLDSKNSLKLYEDRIIDIKNQIEKNVNQIDSNISSQIKVDLTVNTITQIKQFYKLKTVAIFLGSKNIAEISVTEEELKNKIRNLQEKADTIDFAAKLISNKLKLKKDIFLYPLTPSDSHEVTQFSSVFKDNLTKYLKPIDSVDKAALILKGKYQLLGDGKNGMLVTYFLMDKYNNNLETVMLELTPSSYKNYEVLPKTLNFDKLLHEGFVVSKDFKIDITTNRGKTDLLFVKDETVKLLIKMNRAGYYYIVGHVVKPDEKYSYLLELNEGNGDRMFINYINQDDCNKWIELGEFSVEPPFGVESLQIIASNKDLINNVPKSSYDDSYGYYCISKDPEKGTALTRGLKPKKENEVLSAETVLFFTTMK